ncbi:MAG: hypothetical protein ACE141_10055 [Bryobacteraceae bacterium]
MFLKFTFLAAFSVVAVLAQPVILPEKDGGGVFNAASLLYSDLPGGGIAQGAMFIVKGRNLGACQTTVMSSFPFSTSINGVSMAITVGGVTKSAIMYYVVTCIGGSTPDQLAAILPSSTPVGAGTITVTAGGQTSAPFPINVVRSAPGIFTRSANGAGPAWVYNAVTYVPTTPTAPAHPGDYITAMGTGFGPVTYDETNPAPVDLNNLVPDLEVWVGGKKAQMTYNNRMSTLAAVDQANFVVPAGVEGCYVPLVVKSGGKVSNFTTMAIAAQGNTCSDSVGPTADDFQRWAGKNSITVGGVDLSRQTNHIALPPGTQLPPGFSLDSTTDSGDASFLRFDLSTLPNIPNPFNSLNFGVCQVMFFGPGSTSVDIPNIAYLDAGSAITVAGPKGTKQLTKTPPPPNYYSADLGGGSNPLGNPPLFLDAGSYTISGPGGADIGSFSTTYTIPAPLTWTNRDSITEVNRAQDLLITWTGGDQTGYVMISGMSVGTNSGAMFVCTERASAGRFSVPSVVLSAMPPSASADGMPVGSLSVDGATQPKAITPSGCDLCTVSHSAGSSTTVGYK